MRQRSFVVTRVLVLAMFLAAAFSTSRASAEIEHPGPGEASEEAEEGGGGPDWTYGPTTVTLGDGIAEVAIEKGYMFAGAEDTQGIMEAMGNPSDGSEVGLIAPDAEEPGWFMVFEYHDVGYVKDDEQDSIDEAAILSGIREGTEQANAIRKERGMPGVHVVGWSEKPNYDPKTHNLQWALLARDDEDSKVVNYNTRLLGREGFMSVTLVDDPDKLAASKPEVDKILASFTYTDGKKYSQFVSGDRIAEFGLAALVAGGAGAAAAKLGLFAVLAKFFAKAYKAVILGLVALAALIRKMFRALTSREERITMPESGDGSPS